MRRSRAEKAATHSKIIAVAAKRFRELGLQGIGVADVMKEAGYAVGGFYRHFGSRDELVIEALAEAFKDLDSLESNSEDLAAYLFEFISEKHRDAPSTGCAITAFAGEIGHASTGIRAVYTQRVKHTLGYYGDHLRAGDPSARRARAIILLSAGVGGLSLARAVNDKALSREIVAVLRNELTALAQKPIPRPSESKQISAKRR